MPPNSTHHERGTAARDDPVPVLAAEQVPEEDSRDSDVEQTGAGQLVPTRRVRQLRLEETFREVLGPHHDGVGENAQSEDVDEHQARLRQQCVHKTDKDENPHPHRDRARHLAVPHPRIPACTRVF